MKRSTYTLRRLLALVLVLVMVGSLFAGCNKKTDDPTVPEEPSETIAETAAPTEEPTEAPTEEPTEAPTEPEETVPPVIMGTVNADNLNVRSEPYSTASIEKRLAINTRIEILEQKIVDGVNWGRIADGWVNLNYVTIGVEFPSPEVNNGTVVENSGNIGSGTSSTNDNTNGTISATELNIRKEPNADSASVGTYKKGDKVTILERSGNWGLTNKGWINMKYVDFTGTVTGSSSSSSSSTGSSNVGTNSTTVSNGNKAVLGHGTVIITTSLAVRSGPGVNYTQVSFVRKGEVHAYYQTNSNGWVRLEKGWVNADYLQLEYAVESGTEATVTADELSVREQADYNSTRLATYKKGDKVTILEVKGTWGMVEYATGQYGWVDLDKVKLPTPVVSDYTTGEATITADALHIRAEASASSASLGVYKKGDKVTVTEVKGNWGKTADGWINLKYTEMVKTYAPGTGTVTASSLNIRSIPSSTGADVGSLKKGATVTILDTEGTWGKIEYATGKYGWISLNYVNMTSAGTSSGSTSGKYTVSVKSADNGTMKANVTSCAQGTKVTLTATPAPGFALDTVSVKDANGDAVTVTNNSSFVMPASNVTVTATFKASAATTYAITVQSAANGQVLVNTNPAAQGTKIVMTAQPDAGYTLSSLIVVDKDGKTIAVSGNTFTMPASTVTITPAFAATSATAYAVQITPPANATITPSATTAAKGEVVTLTIAPNDGYTLKSVTVKDKDNKAVTLSGTGNSRSFTMPEGNVTVSAELEAKQYNVTIASVTGGTVTANPTKCAVGTPVSLSYTINSGYQLTSLKVYGPSNILVCEGTSFTMPAYDVTVKAVIEKIPHAINIASVGGTVTADKTAAAEGTKVTLTVKPDDGYELDKITVDGNTITGTSFTMPAADVAVNVTFKLKTYSITVVTAANGTISVTPASAKMGESFKVTATPAAGYQLSEVIAKTGTTALAAASVVNNEYTFTMPAGNVTVTATYVANS